MGKRRGRKLSGADSPSASASRMLLPVPNVGYAMASNTPGSSLGPASGVAVGGSSSRRRPVVVTKGKGGVRPTVRQQLTAIRGASSFSNGPGSRMSSHGFQAVYSGSIPDEVVSQNRLPRCYIPNGAKEPTGAVSLMRDQKLATSSQLSSFLPTNAISCHNAHAPNLPNFQPFSQIYNCSRPLSSPSIESLVDDTSSINNPDECEADREVATITAAAKIKAPPSRKPKHRGYSPRKRRVRHSPRLIKTPCTRNRFSPRICGVVGPRTAKKSRKRTSTPKARSTPRRPLELQNTCLSALQDRQKKLQRILQSFRKNTMPLLNLKKALATEQALKTLTQAAEEAASKRRETPILASTPVPGTSKAPEEPAPSMSIEDETLQAVTSIGGGIPDPELTPPISLDSDLLPVPTPSLVDSESVLNSLDDGESLLPEEMMLSESELGISFDNISAFGDENSCSSIITLDNFPIENNNNEITGSISSQLEISEETIMYSKQMDITAELSSSIKNLSSETAQFGMFAHGRYSLRSANESGNNDVNNSNDSSFSLFPLIKRMEFNSANLCEGAQACSPSCSSAVNFGAQSAVLGSGSPPDSVTPPNDGFQGAKLPSSSSSARGGSAPSNPPAISLQTIPSTRKAPIVLGPNQFLIRTSGRSLKPCVSGVTHPAPTLILCSAPAQSGASKINPAFLTQL